MGIGIYIKCLFAVCLKFWNSILSFMYRFTLQAASCRDGGTELNDVDGNNFHNFEYSPRLGLFTWWIVILMLRISFVDGEAILELRGIVVASWVDVDSFMKRNIQVDE